MVCPQFHDHAALCYVMQLNRGPSTWCLQQLDWKDVHGYRSSFILDHDQHACPTPDHSHRVCLPLDHDHHACLPMQIVPGVGKSTCARFRRATSHRATICRPPTRHVRRLNHERKALWVRYSLKGDEDVKSSVSSFSLKS